MGKLFLAKYSSYASIFCAYTTLSLGYSTFAQAQIIPDTTLGNESSIVVEDSIVRGLSANLIEGGAVRGSNIFHSFADFNIPELQRIYFANPAGIENILSRVTGNNPSNLLGTLGVDGNANLFFLNPNGITFGPNSQLDITGSFFSSTAESFDFGNGLLYGVTDTSVPPLLEVTLTPGLQYGANQRAIENTGNLSAGENFTLASNTLNLSGQLTAGSNLRLQAQDTVQIRDSAEQPFIAAAGDELLVQGNELVDIFALNHPDSGLFSGADMVLRSDNTVIGDAHYFSSGSLRFEQLDGNVGDLSSPSDPVILAIGDVLIGNYQGGASLHVLAGGSIRLGNVVINRPGTVDDTIGPNSTSTLFRQLSTVTLSDGSNIIIDGASRPTLDVRAGVDWSQYPDFPNPGELIREISENSVAVSGFTSSPLSSEIVILNVDANVQNANIFITNNYSRNNNLTDNIELNRISIGDINNSINQGEAGDIIVDAHGDILAAQINSNAGGTSLSVDPAFAGDIKLLSERGRITALPNTPSTNPNDINGINATVFHGVAGNIEIRSFGDIQIADIGAYVGLDSQGVVGEGISGRINVVSETGSIDTTQGFLRSSAASGFANDISLKADGNIRLGNLETFTNGPITDPIFRRFLIEQGFDADNIGNSGNITIRSDSGWVSLLEHSLIARGIDTANGGDISIQGDTITLGNRAFIIADSRGSGQGGDITLRPQSSLQILDGSEVFTRAFDTGPAGDILVTSLNSDQQLANVTIQGVIEVNANNLEAVITDAEMRGIGLSSGLFSTSEGQGIQDPGRGGSIRIAEIGNLTINDGGVINGRTRSNAPGGRIEVTAEKINITGGGQILSTTLDGGRAENIFITASNSVDVEGINNSYYDQFAQIRDFYFDEIFDGQNFDEASFKAVEETEKIISPVGASSAIQANDQPEFESITNNAGFLSFVPVIRDSGLTDRTDNAENELPSAVGEAGNIEIVSPVISIRDRGLVASTAFRDLPKNRLPAILGISQRMNNGLF